MSKKAARSSKITGVDLRPSGGQPSFPVHHPLSGMRHSAGEIRGRKQALLSQSEPLPASDTGPHHPFYLLQGDGHRGLGEETEMLFENGLPDDIADLYTCGLNTRLSALPVAKSAENIIRSIRGSVEVPFQRVLFALHPIRRGNHGQIPGGTSGNVDAVHATREELIEADEAGGKRSPMPSSTTSPTREPADHRAAGASGFANRSCAQSLGIESLAAKISSRGRFSGHSRDELKELTEAHGGKNLAAVSANVDFACRRKDRPAKLQKGDQPRTPISEEELLAMIASGERCP